VLSIAKCEILRISLISKKQKEKQAFIFGFARIFSNLRQITSKWGGCPPCPLSPTPMPQFVERQAGMLQIPTF